MNAPRPRGEFEWIARLVEILGDSARAAIGDDTAVVEHQGRSLAWTVDTLVEGVHFRFDWLEPATIGRRALVASLSDLAATGARPLGALVSAAGPAATIADRIEGIYEGLRVAAEETECAVLGGDLARAEGPLHLTVTALGEIVGKPLRRGGVRAGDELWVTGALGGPAAAVALLSASSPEAIPDLRDHPAYERLAAPRARNAEVHWLLEHAEIHAAIDVSDGLSGDAGHLAERSGVRIVLEPGRLPLHHGAALAGRALGIDPEEWALHGGEEFELLLAAPPAALERQSARFAARFGVPLTRIGEAHLGAGLLARRGGREERLDPASWDHFANRA
jgi:thiamine-monophosphate kinase